MTDHRARAIGSLAFAALIVCASFVPGADRSAKPSAARQPARPAAPTEPENAAAGRHASQVLSEAERIARLDRSLRSDEKRLSELKATLNEPDRESMDAEADFEQLDAQLIEKRKQRERREKVGTLEGERGLRDEIASLEKKWALARDRFDLAIRERKAVQESVGALEQKIEHDRQALEELRGATTSETATRPATTPGTAIEAGQGLSSPGSSATTPAEPAAASSPAKTASGAIHQTGADVTVVAPASKDEKTAELVAATEVAQKAELAAAVAEKEAHSISERTEILQKNIALARQLRETAHKKVDNADETLKSLNEELFVKLREGANTEALKQEIQEATERVREARTESREASQQIDELQSTVAELQSEQLAAADDAKQKRQSAEQADAVVKDLNNPFTVHNLLQWLLDHGPKTFAILIAIVVCLRLSRVIESRLVSLVANRSRIGNRKERENRAKTLLGIFHNATNIVILGGGVVVVLDEVGIPIAPLVGGAAVVGLAVAFGAQSLIKDYFTGFLVLLEHQYLVNDIVKIGPISGQVERITLRTTALRDAEGHLHFIPHGQIATVTNTTHGWSRAVVEIRVSYRENIDRVIGVLAQLAGELCASEPYSRMILEPPALPVVDALTDLGVVVKFNIKTLPLQAVAVRRELLRRIKNKFDEQGIEIPYLPPMIYRRGDSKFSVLTDNPDRRAG